MPNAHPKLDRFLVLLNALGPTVLALTPGAEKYAAQIPVVVAAIGVAEQFPGASGPEKKAYVQAITQAGVSVANATGKVHLDPAEFQMITDKGIDAVIAAIHAVHSATVDVPAVAAAALPTGA